MKNKVNAMKPRTSYVNKGTEKKNNNRMTSEYRQFFKKPYNKS